MHYTLQCVCFKVKTFLKLIYWQLPHPVFLRPFDSPEALQAAMSSPGMQEAGADATRISPVILIGSEV